MLPRSLLHRVLLNAFRLPCTIGNSAKRKRSALNLESLEDRVVPSTFEVYAIGDTAHTPRRGQVFKDGVALAPSVTVETATTNDFTLINQAIQSAANGDTIILNGTFDWAKPFALASWTKGSDNLASFTVGGVPGTADTTDDADNYSLAPPQDLNNITLTAATPTAGKYAAVVKKATTDSATVDVQAFLYFDHSGTNSGWTISNLEIDNFDLAIGMYENKGPSNAYDNTTITNNKISVPKDVKGATDDENNVGILVGPGVNQTISNNYILLDGGGASSAPDTLTGVIDYAESVGIQTQPAGGSAYDGLKIIGNKIEVQKAANAKPEIVIGVWDNASAHSSDITISNNSFTNKVTPKPASNLERAFRITSHSSATTTVAYSNNIVAGANIGFQWLPASFGPPTPDFSGNQPIQLTGNSISNTAWGVLVQSNGVVTLTNNTIAYGPTGSTGVDIATGTLTGATENIITGLSTGILIEATAGSVGAINGNHIANNTTFNLNNLSAIAIDATNNWWGASGTTLGTSGAGSFGSALATSTTIDTATEFDFQKTNTSRVEGDAIPILPTAAYTTAQGYGWVGSVPVGFDQTTALLTLLEGNPLASELADGVVSTVEGDAGARTFRIDFPDTAARQITVFLGNGSLAYDNVEVAVSTNDGVSYTPITSGTGATVVAKTFGSVSSETLFPAGITPGGAANSIFIRIRDSVIAGGSKKGWAVAGLSVTPILSLGTLTVTPPGGALTADSTSSDTYTVSGATPFSLLTVTTDLGTLLTADASPAVSGIQILADASGNASFQIKRPFLGGTATVTVTDFEHRVVSGSTTQVYAFPTTGDHRRFDMNLSTDKLGPSLPDSTWLNVGEKTLYSAATGFGWQTAVKGLDPTTVLNAPGGADQFDTNLYRDFNYNTVTAPGVFKVDLGAGYANTTVSVRVFVFAPAAQNPTGMTVKVGSGSAVAYTAGVNFIDATGAADANGLLTITFTKGLTPGKAWVVNGLDITL